MGSPEQHHHRTRPSVLCVGGIVRHPDGRLLLIQRGQEPSRGRWSVPGGRVNPGEDLLDATRREVHEETGVEVTVGALVGTVERDAPDGSLYLIHDFACEPVTGTPYDDPVAGDDADDAGWFTAAEVRALDCAPGLVEAFEEWGVLER